MVMVLALVLFLGDPLSAFLASFAQRGEPGVEAVSKQPVGRELFGTYCVPCHGKNGDKLPRVNLRSREFLGIRDDASLARAISQGKGAMPPLGGAEAGALGEVQIRAIVEFLRSGELGGPWPRVAEWKSTAKGAEVFKNNCGCHVPISGPSEYQGVLRQPGAGATRGVHDFLGKLSDAEIEAVLGLILSTRGTEGPGPFADTTHHVDTWLFKHSPYVKGNGASLCYKCHQNAYCAACHTGGR